MNAIIVGSGNVGSRLSRQLTDRGHQVVVLDINADALRNLPRGRVDSGIIQVLVRDGSLSSSLVEAGITNAEVLVAATGIDPLNGLIAQKAKEMFNVAKVVTAVKDTALHSMYESMGIETVNRSESVAGQLMQSITGEQD
jgi:trk system potassium uptake protein TrkA